MSKPRLIDSESTVYESEIQQYLADKRDRLINRLTKHKWTGGPNTEPHECIYCGLKVWHSVHTVESYDDSSQIEASAEPRIKPQAE